jgi:hypothetical protein
MGLHEWNSGDVVMATTPRALEAWRDSVVVLSVFGGVGNRRIHSFGVSFVLFLV